MYTYPAAFIEDGRDTLVICPDIPEAITETK